jgi:hypothetical protein
VRMPGIRVSGELDFAAGAYLSARLAEYLPGRGDILIDAGELTFADVGGSRALLEVALELAPPRRLVVRSAPTVLVRVLELCGWLSFPQLQLQTGDGSDARAGSSWPAPRRNPGDPRRADRLAS